MQTQVKDSNGPGVRSTSRYLWPVAIAILLNSVAVAYGFRQLTRVSEAIKWVVAPTIARQVAQVVEDSSNAASSPVLVELFSDFDCSFCRRSAAAVDAARMHFGNSVEWRYRFAARSPTVSGLSFHAALVGVCTSSDDGPWRLYHAVGEAGEWSERAFEEVVKALGTDPKLLLDCTLSDATISRVWSDIFEGAARGVKVTPTIIVNQTRVEGELSAESLIELIESKLSPDRQG